MKIGELRTVFLDALKGIYPSEEIESFFTLLMEAWLGYSRLDLTMKSESEVSSEVKVKIDDAIQRLKKEEPIQYIIGSTEFYGLTFEVNSHTLVPRPETEELVDWIVREHGSGIDVLDIGTGSGCIAVSVAKSLPESSVTAIDISEATLKVAERNAKRNGTHVDFRLLNVLETDSLPGSYDLIVSNPPYVREMEKEQMKGNVLLYEPEVALFVPDDDPLLFYRRIVSLADTSLNNHGWLIFEINEYLGEDMCSLLEGSGLQNVELRKDFRGKDRFIRGQKLFDDKAK